MSAKVEPGQSIGSRDMLPNNNLFLSNIYTMSLSNPLMCSFTLYFLRFFGIITVTRYHQTPTPVQCDRERRMSEIYY